MALLVVAPVAYGHGLGSEDPNRPVFDYLWLGTKHLLAGWDHLLFILAIVLVSQSLWRATKMMSLFVLGHSITLSIATFMEWQVSTAFVDVVIALSVVAVAAAGLAWKEPDWKLFGGGLFAFGLIHGLGLSTRLQELGVSDDSLFARVLLFNVGIEIGQAIAVLAFAAIGRAIIKVWVAPEKLRRPAFTVIGVAGLVGAMILTIPTSDPEPPVKEADTAAAEVKQNCVTVEEPGVMDGVGGTHPERRFYGPEEPYPETDFGHVLGDGYVVATYRPAISASQVAELQAIVDNGQEGLLAGAEPDQEHDLVLITRELTMRCAEFDAEAVAKFRDDWIASIRN